MREFYLVKSDQVVKSSWYVRIDVITLIKTRENHKVSIFETK